MKEIQLWDQQKMNQLNNWITYDGISGILGFAELKSNRNLGNYQDNKIKKSFYDF